jgi:hypothetical protein
MLASVTTLQASESAAEYFARDKGVGHAEKEAAGSSKIAASQKTKETIAREVSKALGEKWVSVALNQAKRESNFNHKAIGVRLGKRHGGQRAVGTFQILPSTAAGLGFDRRRLGDLEYGVLVGIAYMDACIKSGASNDYQMNKCFLYGTYGWRGKNGKRNKLKA